MKLRYFATTRPQSSTRLADKRGSGPGYRCKECGSATSDSCHVCLEELVHDVGRAFRAIAGDEATVHALSGQGNDPRPDMALTSSVALLKLGGLGSRRVSTRGSPIKGVSVPRFLQATLLLDGRLQSNPGDVRLRLLLVKLYLLLGCGTIAHQLWLHMDVKRTIQDALSPLFFDRISTVAPTLFHTSSGKPLLGSLKKYYQTSLRSPAPVTIWAAFAAGSYTSILDMAEFDDRLRRSCTRVMAAVEERRGARFFGGKVDDTGDADPFGKWCPAHRAPDR